MRIVRTGENQYRIEGLDRNTLRDVPKALQVYVTKAHEKGYGGYSFDPVIRLIVTKNLEQMKIKQTNV